MPESPADLDVDSMAMALLSAALDDAIAALDALSVTDRTAGLGRERTHTMHRKDAAVIRGMNALCARLGVHLMRWVGADGWQALLRRGLDEAVKAGRAVGLALDANGELRWVDEASVAMARDACIQVLVGVTRVLTRFVGGQMALRLIELGVARRDDTRGEGTDHG